MTGGRALLAACLVLSANRASAQSCPAGMVLVHAGMSWVGAPYGECPDEALMPTRAARVGAMCLDAREVRVSEYERCVASGACPARAALPECASDGDAAVDCVSWDGARAYCGALGGMVPTEAQLDHGYQSGALELPAREVIDDASEWTASRGDAAAAHLPPRRGHASDRVTRFGVGELGELVPATEHLPHLGFRCRRDLEPVPRWTLPECIASSADGGFACRDFEFTTDEHRGGSMRDIDPRRHAPRSGVAWGARRSVVMLGEAITSLDLMVRPYDADGEVRIERSSAAATRELEAAGYDRPVAASLELTAGRWIRLGALWLRFETHHHTGDTSEHDVGSLRLACADPMGPTVELLGPLRASRAFAFVASSASSAIAIGWMEIGGGEGALSIATHYRRITATDCPAR